MPENSGELQLMLCAETVISWYFLFSKLWLVVAKNFSNIQKVFGEKTKSNLTTWKKKHQKKMQYWNLLFHYYVILPYTFKVKRMHKIRRRDTV